MEQVAETRFAIGKGQAIWQEGWTHRAEVGVRGVVLLPLCGREAVFKLECGG